MKQKATFTVTRNESVFLWEWFIHNLKFFDINDIYVLDHDSSDGSVEQLLAFGLPLQNVTKIQTDKPFTNEWLTDQGSIKQHELLKSYEWVIFAETDEFVFPDITKCPGGYDELLCSLKRENKTIVRCLGYDMLHDYRSEPHINLNNKPWLSQRRFARIWRPELNGGKMLFSKPILSSTPVRWRAGQHDLRNCPLITIDERLILIHCHFLDIGLCEERRSTRVKQGEKMMPGDRKALGEALRNELLELLQFHSHEIPEEIRKQF